MRRMRRRLRRPICHLEAMWGSGVLIARVVQQGGVLGGAPGWLVVGALPGETSDSFVGMSELRPLAVFGTNSLAGSVPAA